MSETDKPPSEQKSDPIEEIAAIAESGDAPEPPLGEGPEIWPDDDDGDFTPPEITPEERRSIDMAAVEIATAEPQNDTGNGQRLLLHFGGELLNVREMSTDRVDAWHQWDGKRWQRDGGNEFALLCAQRCAPRIQLEADFLTAAPSERKAIARGEDAAIELAALEDKATDARTDGDRKRMIALSIAVNAGKDAAAALEKRQVARRKFAVSSGNGARLREMLKQAAPHATAPLGDLDADPLALNCANGTLRFIEAPDPECPDPDVKRMTWTVRLDPHNPADRISKLAPVEYRADAQAPKFIASLARFQPSELKRRWLQKYHGYAITGLNSEQCALFNHGSGANWKSTYIEIIARIMGDYSEMLKFESLAEVGDVTGAQANPDFARLPGVRLVRTTEVERGVALKEGLLKSLTSGEPWLARHNFGNFFSFYPSFKIAMTGNNKPSIGGVDHGIWRRIRFLIWPVTITEDEKRDLDDVLAELWEEREGILAWLVEGALAYLKEGLKPPPDMLADAEEYREEMDPVGGFLAAHVTRLPEQPDMATKDIPSVGAGEMFDAFERWCAINGAHAWKQTAFGRAMGQKGINKSRVPGQRRYIWVVLHDVPARKPRAGEQPPHPADDHMSEEVPR